MVVVAADDEDVEALDDGKVRVSLSGYAAAGSERCCGDASVVADPCVCARSVWELEDVHVVVAQFAGCCLAAEDVRLAGHNANTVVIAD